MSTKINRQNRCRTVFPFDSDETFGAGVGDKIELTVTIGAREHY